MPEEFLYRQSLQQIETVIRRAGAQSDDFLAAQVAQHVCVRLSGTLENAVRQNVIRMISPSSHPRALRYVSRRLSEFQNPKPGKIEELFEAFDKDWLSKLQAFWEPEVKDAIGSIVGQRNIIAHGGATDVSLGRVSGWFQQAKSFCTFLESLS
jgi:hypothetical protein